MGIFSKNKALLPKDVQEAVVARIQEAEKNTTGELRIFVESHCTYVDAMDRAKELFEQLGMTETVKRNAVLVYLALNDKQFAILGDKEIYEQAGGATFWQKAAEHMRTHFSNGDIKSGLCVGIDELGYALAENFPYDPEVTKNELPDEIVFGK